MRERNVTPQSYTPTAEQIKQVMADDPSIRGTSSALLVLHRQHHLQQQQAQKQQMQQFRSEYHQHFGDFGGGVAYRHPKVSASTSSLPRSYAKHSQQHVPLPISQQKQQATIVQKQQQKPKSQFKHIILQQQLLREQEEKAALKLQKKQEQQLLLQQQNQSQNQQSHHRPAYHSPQLSSRRSFQQPSAPSHGHPQGRPQLNRHASLDGFSLRWSDAVPTYRQAPIEHHPSYVQSQQQQQHANTQPLATNASQQKDRLQHPSTSAANQPQSFVLTQYPADPHGTAISRRISLPVMTTAPPSPRMWPSPNSQYSPSLESPLASTNTNSYFSYPAESTDWQYHYQQLQQQQGSLTGLAITGSPRESFDSSSKGSFDEPARSMSSSPVRGGSVAGNVPTRMSSRGHQQPQQPENVRFSEESLQMSVSQHLQQQSPLSLPSSFAEHGVPAPLNAQRQQLQSQRSHKQPHLQLTDQQQHQPQQPQAPSIHVEVHSKHTRPSLSRTASLPALPSSAARVKEDRPDSGTDVSDFNLTRSSSFHRQTLPTANSLPASPNRAPMAPLPLKTSPLSVSASEQSAGFKITMPSLPRPVRRHTTTEVAAIPSRSMSPTPLPADSSYPTRDAFMRKIPSSIDLPRHNAIGRDSPTLLNRPMSPPPSPHLLATPKPSFDSHFTPLPVVIPLPSDAPTSPAIFLNPNPSPRPTPPSSPTKSAPPLLPPKDLPDRRPRTVSGSRSVSFALDVSEHAHEEWLKQLKGYRRSKKRAAMVFGKVFKFF
ncbi:hypothetical protein DFS34DRAFT_591273 [Phlyctochytrium arcticum]|nr:hypothetical protein DFS34DRAFT_591273 [Phlyctochytrium arcticum]